jgi:stage V sporulation protein G
MEITEVRIALREQAVGSGVSEGRSGETRLKAYATLTFDHCFVVRNIKIIDGKNGLFVAMPSHKPKVACPRCQFKGESGGRFCPQCGASIPRPAPPPPGAGDAGEPPGHRDIAHPITVEFRQYLQRVVLAAYDAERVRAHAEPTSVGDEV